MSYSLDSRDRTDHFRTLNRQQWDVLVIGGGITGAGIALDAISRGLKVALVEMQDFGAGTSSRSTKLIHGGLRYLKQFEIGLVREVGQERKILHRNAPHLVIPEEMLLPVVKGGTFGKLSLSFGLWIYDRLAGVRREERRKMLGKAAVLQREPLLNAEGLRGAGLYHEYRTDDARLVIEVMKTAAGQGALCMNYVRANGFAYEGGTITGVEVEDLLGKESGTVKARTVINAAGPWVDEVRKQDGPVSGKRLHHTKGVHLVVRYEKLPVRDALYFDVFDGRMIFVIPRGRWTYIGTTDTNYTADPAQPGVSQADADYLVSAVNRMMPGVNLTQGDVVSSWSGIRPLIHEEGKGPSELSRKDEIFYADSGLITIAGGKLTGFRKMAERAVDAAVKQGNLDAGPCVTDRIVLTGGDLDMPLKDYIRRLQKDFEAVDAEEIDWLVRLYGRNSEKILKVAMTHGGGQLELVMAALEYSMYEEAACTMADFFTRRAALMYFGRPWIAPVLDTVGGTMAAAFSWDTEAGFVAMLAEPPIAST